MFEWFAFLLFNTVLYAQMPWSSHELWDSYLGLGQNLTKARSSEKPSTSQQSHQSPLKKRGCVSCYMLGFWAENNFTLLEWHLSHVSPSSFPMPVPIFTILLIQELITHKWLAMKFFWCLGPYLLLKAEQRTQSEITESMEEIVTTWSSMILDLKVKETLINNAIIVQH